MIFRALRRGAGVQRGASRSAFTAIAFLTLGLLKIASAETVALSEDQHQYTAEREIAQRIFAAEISEANSIQTPSGPLVVELALADLDADGRTEILGRLNHATLCGSHGCQFFILRFDGTVWRQILSDVIAGPEVILHERRVNGFRTLSFDDAAYEFVYQDGRYR